MNHYELVNYWIKLLRQHHWNAPLELLPETNGSLGSSCWEVESCLKFWQHLGLIFYSPPQMSLVLYHQQLNERFQEGDDCFTRGGSLLMVVEVTRLMNGSMTESLLL